MKAPRLNTSHIWVAVSLILGSIAALGVLFIYGCWQSDFKNETSRAQTELKLLTSISADHLEKGNYQQLPTLFESWGKAHADITYLRLTTSNGFVLAEYKSGATAQNTAQFEAPIPYGYRGEAKLKLQKDLSSIDAAAVRLAWQLGGTFLVFSILSLALARMAILHLRETQSLRQRTDDLNLSHASLVNQINERRAAESARDRLIAVVEASPDFIGVANLENIAVYINRAGLDMIGMKELPVTPLPISSLHPPEAARVVGEEGIPVALAEGVWRGDTALLRRDGSEFSVTQVIVCHRGPDGKPEFLSTLMRDTSELHASTQRLEERDALLRRLSEQVPGVIYQFRRDADGSYSFPYASQGIVDVMEIAPEEIKTDARIFFSRVHPDNQAAVLENILNSFHALSDWHDEFRVVLPQRGERWLRGDAVPLQLGDGVVMWHGYISDVTDRKHAEHALASQQHQLEQIVVARTAELSMANRELESFAYTVSHDLRAPLRTIEGFAPLLVGDDGNPAEAERNHLISRIQAAARRMSSIITDLLEFSRVRTAQLVAQEVDISALASSVAAELHAIQPARKVTWKIEAGLIAHCDPGLMHSVLENLLGNAWKYSGKVEHAIIELGRDKNSDQDGFFVRDNGAGFNMEYAGQLFQALRRLHGEREFEGTGIGLATVHRILERHGGSISGEGRVNEGATFIFSLPRQKPQTPA